MKNTQEQQPVSASLVADNHRLTFLPSYFGPRQMIRGEALVYAWLRKLSDDYNGGYWHYYTLTNGGFYMAPRLDKRLRLEVAGNGFGGEMSADAAGIVATLFALCQLASEIQGKDDSATDALVDRYLLLRDFAGDHAEARLIFQAID